MTPPVLIPIEFLYAAAAAGALLVALAVTSMRRWYWTRVRGVPVVAVASTAGFSRNPARVVIAGETRRAWLEGPAG